MQKSLLLVAVSLLLSAPHAAQAQVIMTSLPVPRASLSIMPVFYSIAPAFMIFTISNPSDTESIDFGDGHTTGSNGCIKNTRGWCDLSAMVWHRYDYPGRYLVTLYAHYAPKTYQILSTTTVTVTP